MKLTQTRTASWDKKPTAGEILEFLTSDIPRVATVDFREAKTFQGEFGQSPWQMIVTWEEK